MNPTINTISPWAVFSYGFSITCFSAVILFSFGAWAAEIIGATFRKAATAAVLVASAHVAESLLGWGVAELFMNNISQAGLQSAFFCFSIAGAAVRVFIVWRVYETQWNKAVLLWLLHAGCTGFVAAMANLFFG